MIVAPSNKPNATAEVLGVNVNQGTINLKPLTSNSLLSSDGQSLVEYDVENNVLLSGALGTSCTSIISQQAAPKHHLDDEGNIVSQTSETTVVTNFEFEEWVNDANRTIRVIKPELITKIVAEFEKEIPR